MASNSLSRWDLIGIIIFAIILNLVLQDQTVLVLGKPNFPKFLNQLPSSGAEFEISRLPRMKAMDTEIKNEIEELLLSNPDYIMDHHSRKFRRVKKVLIPPTSNELNFIQTYYNEKRPLIYSRKKRFLERKLNDLIQIQPLQKSGIQIANHSPSSIKSPNLNINLTSIELKFFQNGLLSIVKDLCPDLGTRYPIILTTVQESVENEIHFASLNGQLLNQIKSNNDLILSIIKKLKKCILLKKSNQQKEILKLIPTNRGRYSRFRQNFEQEAKRLALLSQKDVYPTQENTAMFYQFIKKHLQENCFENDLLLKNEMDRVGNSLVSIIRSKKDKRYGREPTIHQKEMEELLYQLNGCVLQKFSK